MEMTTPATVIFVAGTSRSGSTLLNLILANDPKGLALGEIHALLRPVKFHHITERKAIDSEQDVWSAVLRSSPDELHAAIARRFPDRSFLVDSSKHVFWIADRNRDCDRQGLGRKNVLIYKNPYELAHSFRKRGKDWLVPFIGYHRRYLSSVDRFLVVSYKEVVSNPAVLKRVCDYVGIPFSEAKYQYWESEGDLFFGSRTPTQRREIRYDAPHDAELIRKVDDVIARNPTVAAIWSYLEAVRNTEASSSDPRASAIRFNAPQLWLHRLKYGIDGHVKRLFPKKLIDPIHDGSKAT